MNGHIAIRTVFCFILVTSLLSISLPFHVGQGQAQGASRKMNNFEVSGRFLEEWSRQGSEQASVYVNGLPITARRPEISLTDGRTYEMQWFERARYEAHPENPPPYDVLLGLLGSSLAEGRGATDPSTGKIRNPGDQPFIGINRPADVDDKNKVWYAETRHSISGKILEYWTRYGGIKQFGFPLSEPFQEMSRADGKLYTVQYFERNRFELHPEKPAPYEVELGLLGVEQYNMQAVPGDQLPVAPPKGLISLKETLTIAMSQEPGSLFPLFDRADVAHTASEPIYDGLVNRDSKDNPYPEVAWYVPTVENGGAYFAGVGDDRHLVVKYKLRRGIKWSDGVEITAADALYHHKLALDPNSPVPDRTLYEKIYHVDSPDRHTLIYNYMSYAQARDLYARSKDKERVAFLKQFVDQRRPVIDPMYNMVGNILPSHILGKMRPERILSSEYARNPVGNGPFKVERWDPGSQIVLAQNPNYNLTDKPLLKRIVIRLIADQNHVLAQLRSGALDAATRDVFPNPMAALGNWGADPKVEYAPSYVWQRIDFNLDRPIFQDKAVRQAIAHAINRQKIADEVMLGKATVQHSFISPASWASMQNPDFARGWESKFPVKKYEHNPDLANQMLDNAGWARGPDGIRTKGEARLSFVYAAISGNRASRQVAELVVKDLKAVGVDAKIQYVTSCPGYPDCDYLRKRQHDLAEYAAPSSPDPSGSNYDSRNIPTPENQYKGSNYSGYRNPRFDELSRSAANELDRTKRAPLFAEMQALWAEDLPAIPLYPRLNIEVHKLSLVGWETSVGSTPSTYKVAAMYFK